MSDGWKEREGERRGLFNHFSVSFFFVVLLLQMCTRIYRWKNRLSVLFPFNEASEGSRITFPRGIFPFYKHFHIHSVSMHFPLHPLQLLHAKDVISTQWNSRIFSAVEKCDISLQIMMTKTCSNRNDCLFSILFFSRFYWCVGGACTD